jgi:hypothetical protein
MKWFIRKYCDGKVEQLRKSMAHGLSEANLPIALIRRYTRIVSAYFIAYKEGKDIIQAESWINKHRTHRGDSGLMDAQLEALYFPLGRYVDRGVEEEAMVDGGRGDVGEDNDEDEVDYSDFDELLLMANDLELDAVLAEFGEIIV